MTNPKDLVKSLNAADTLTDSKVKTPEQFVNDLNALPDYGPGRVSQGSAIIDSTKGIDHSFLDVETPFGISVAEQRAKNQTTTDKWLSGGIKGLSTFVTATGQTVGAVGGGVAATAMMALGNDFDSDLMFKNPVLEFFAKWNETVKERNPNYYSEAEINASVIEGMATANFWSDKFLDGVGFMASAIMTGYGAAKFGAQLGINIAGKIGSGFNTLQAALVGRTGESAIEANDAYEQTLERLKATRLLGEHNLTDEEIEDRAKDARAATFGFNMAIAVTDAYQFGKIFKTIEGQAVKKSIFGGSRVGHAAEQMLIESQEENYQLAVADMAINMANNVTSKETNNNARDYFNNIVGGMMDNFSTKEGQESMLLGGLLGGGMGLAMHSNDRTKQMNKNVPEEIKKRNNKLMSVFNKDIDANLLERVAATQNDGIVEGLAKNLQLINLTLSKIIEGTYDEFIEELDGMAKQTPEQFKEIGITVTEKDIKQQHSDAKSLIENYKALYDAMDPTVFDLKQENAYEAIKANLFYVTAARNDIRTQLQKVGPYMAAVSLALKTEPDLAMDEPIQVGTEQVIPQKVKDAQEKLVENRDALTKYINRVKTGKKLQKEIVDAYNQAQEVPTPVPTPTPKADPEIGSIQKVGKEGAPAKNIPFTKAVQLEDGSTNYTVLDSEGLETIINDQKDSYTLIGYKGEFRGERQELNNNERYNFLQVFEKFVSEEDLSRLQEILSLPNWKENVRITANKQNTGNVFERIRNFIAQKGTTTDIDNVYRTAVVGDNPMYLVPSSFIQIEMQIKDKDGNWTRMGHPGADPFKWRDRNGIALNFSNMTLEEFKDKFIFKQGTVTAGTLIEPTQASFEQLQREQQESIKVYNAINDWYEKNGFSDLREIPEGFVKMFTRKMGFAFTKVGEWTKAKDFELDEGITSILRDNNENYVIIDMNTGRSIVDGKKYDVPAHIRKELGNTRYITKVNHPTIEDLYIKAAPGQLDGSDARDFIDKLTEVRENPTQDGAEELNAIMYIAYQGNWNFKFDVHTIKGTKVPKLVVDVFNDQLGKSYKNIALPINISSLGTLQSLIENGTDGEIKLGRFAFKKHIAKDKLTNKEVERVFTFNTTPEIINGINLQFKFNTQAPVEPARKADIYDEEARQRYVVAKNKAEGLVVEDEGKETDSDRIKRESREYKSKPGEGPVFKTAAEKASDVIHYEQALTWLSKILPKGISVADMATVTENLETQGYTWGMFANKVIYLSKQAGQGTEAHEAFHAIFRVMLTEAERTKLYGIAQAKWGKGKTPLFYEEKMADEFMDWKNARNRRVSGILQAFFNKIIQFAKFITGRESELERLFRKIDTGAFTNKELLNHQVHVYDAPVYKLLNGKKHYRMSVVKSENILYSTAAYVLEQLNNNMEYQNIPNAVKKLTTDYMFAQSTNYDIDLDVNKEIIAASDDKFIREKMADLENIYQDQENIDLVTAEVLKLVRTYEIRSIDTIIDEQDDTEESFKAFDIHQGEHGGWANVAKEIKQFIALTTYNTFDEFNKHITKSIDFVLVYGALQRRLAGKSRAQQLLSFESFARTDQQVNALWNKFLVETGYDPTTGVKTNEMMFNRFLNTFELESMDYMQSLRVKDKDGTIKLINMSANRANAEVIHFENWERKASEYNIFADQSKKDDLAEELIFDAAVGFGVDTSGVNKQNSMEFFEAHIRQIISTFGKMGIDLSEGYVLESLEEVHNIGTKLEGVDADRAYRMLEEQDLLEIANLLKKGDNIFAQKLDADGNVLEKTGARGRLIAMASGDINYRTDIYDANFQDAENKSRYAFVYPSYILTKIRDKHNITEAELQEMKEDPYYKYNPLVQSAKSAEWFLNFKAAFTGDYRDTVEDTDGKTFKSTTPKDLLLSWYGLYNKGKEYSYYTPMIYEAKSTSISVNLPNNVNDGKSWVDKKGEVTNETIKYFIDTMFMQEHERINGNTGITFIERKKNPWVTLPYFNGLKNKGNYITEYSKQDIIDNKEGVRITIGNAIKANLNSEIEAHQTELIKYGIITNDKANKLLDSDIENVTEYTAEYYINDLVNSTAISQIIQGDLSKAKNPFDRVKRNGGELAYGTHFGEDTYKVVYKTEDKRKDGIDRDDAQVYVSMKRRIDQLDRLGRLTDETRVILEKVQDGQSLTDKEINKLDLLPLKTVHYGDQDGYMVYHKMSETVLTRELTSKLVKKGDIHVWVAKKGKEKLHNMIEFMEANEVDSIVTLSASKLENPSEALKDSEFISGVPTMGERFTDLDNRYLRLQVETHSGKEKIVSGTQMAQLIDLLYETNSGLKDRYYQLLAETRAEDFTIAEFMSKNAALLANKLVESIETSGGDAQIVELLAVENGEFKYNFNLPHVAEKLEQLLLSHFSKGVLQQKVPGYKLTLMSSSGYMIEDKETGEVRELKTHQVSEDGKVIELAEAVMTRRALRKIMGPKADVASIEEINKELLEMVGTRIPTQAHHSMIPFKVVEFLPEYYGDTIIAPAGIVKLSGADYDIDSLFVYRKDFFMDDNKNVHVYGDATTQKDKYAEYLNHHSSNLSVSRTRRNREASYPGRAIEEIRQEVFSEYGLITTFEDYVTAGLPSNNSNRNNELVDTYLTILTDPSVEDMFKPATLDLLQDAVAKVHDTLRNKGNENATVNHYGSNGKLKAHTATSTGKRNVGPVAFINNVSAFMTKHKVHLSESILFLGKTYADYGVTTEQDIEIYKEDGQWKVREATRDNQSKINSLSTLVSGMTDDAKWGFSAKLNLEEFNLGLFASMISLGVGFNRTMLFSSQDVLAELSSEIKTSGTPHEAALLEKITEYKKKAIGLRPVFKEYKDYEVWAKANPEQALIAEEVHLNDQLLVDNLQPGNRTIARDLAILEQYQDLQETAAKFQAVGTIISLNKGVEVVNVMELNEKLRRVDEIEAKENGKEPFYDNLWEALTSNANTATNMRLLRSIKSQMSRWFISGTTTYDNIMEILDPSLKKFLKTQDKTTVDRAIKSFLTARGYQRMLEKHGSDIKVVDFNALLEPGIKNSLIEKTLAKQIEELSTQEDKQAAKDFNNNEFIKILRTQFKFTVDGILNAKNESELDLVTSNMRIKRNPQTIDRITNGFVELSLDHPELAKNLFRYAMAKDSLQFNSTSFLKFLDVTYLAVASEGLDSIMDDPSANAGMEYDFVKLFAGYSMNNALFPAKNAQYLKSVGVFGMKDGSFVLKEKSDRKGIDLPPFIFKTKGGQIYMQESKTSVVWNQVKPFGDKYQLPYHMLYEEAIGLPTKSIAPDVKINTDQELPTKVKVTPTIPTVKTPSKEISQEKGNRLEYNNTSVPIEFKLGEEQEQALEGLLDFVTKESGISKTLQGSAGTGKTTIISFMERIIKKGGYPHNVLYMAPTHAATAVLGFETMKSGNRYLPATIASSLRDDYERPGKTFAKKMQDRFSDFKPPLIIVDEASMLREDEIDGLEEAVEKFGGKIIFMGDIAQIPHVDPRNPAVKQVSKVFSAPDKIVLNEVHRQSKGPLLNLLTKIRRNTQFVNYNIAKVFESLKFLSTKEFATEIIEDIKNNSENTVFISYTNKSVKGANVRAREILGREGYTVVGDSILGYIGYQNKQIEKQHLANSIKYTLTGIKDGPSDGSKLLHVESEALGKLQAGGIQNVRSKASTTYYQLENDDSLQFDLSQEQMAENNRQVSSVFKELYELVLRKDETNMSWRHFTESKRAITDKLASVELGDTYMYDQIQDKMVKFNAQGFQRLKSQMPIRLGNEFKFEKGIDYGHAITIHKSQGMTVDNVYFDLNSLIGIKDTIIQDRGSQINSEKNSLYYVGMSRAAKKLVVNTTGIPFDETFDTTKESLEEEEPSLAPPISSTESVLDVGMYFNYSGNQRDGLETESTFEAIKKGERTSTLRRRSWYSNESTWNSLKNLKKGDLITVWSEKGNKGESIQVRLTRSAFLIPEGTTLTISQLSVLSDKEGWSMDYLEAKGYKTFAEDTINLQYEYIKSDVPVYKGPTKFPKTKAEALAKKPEKDTLQARMTKAIVDAISPTAKKHLPKEQTKTKYATQYIGDGSPGSSTDRYRKMYEIEGVANTGTYIAKDIVYVSSNGKRGGRVNPVQDGVLQGEYVNVQKAMDAGAFLMMDTLDHLTRTKGYNIGEAALAEYVTANGYVRHGDTGVWKPGTKKVADPIYKGPTKFPATKEEALAKKVRKSKNVLSKEDGLDTLISYNFGKAIKRLSKAFGIKVEYVYQPDANWSGRYQHGVVQLNLALLQSDTPFHEFAHPFVEAIRIQNKALYDKLVAEIKKEGTILAKVIEKYPELDDAGRIDEAITTAIGMYGAKIANMPKTLVEKIKEFLAEIMRFIKGLYTPGTIFLPSELDPNTTLQDLGAIMAKNTQVFALGELTDEQAKYQKQQASKLTVDQDHVGAVANKTKTSSLREIDPDLSHKVGDKLAVYANSRNQGMIVELTDVRILKSLKDIDKNKFAESLGYKDWADFTKQNKYAQKDSPAAQNFPALYNFLKGEGEMQWLQYKMVDIVPIGAESYLEDKIKRIKTVVKKQIDRYNSIITKKGNSEEKIKLFVKRRERLLKTIDAIDDAAGVASYIADAKKDLAAAKSELKELMNQIGNVRNLTDRQRKKAINDLHYVQEFIVAYDVIDKMSKDEVEEHLGDTELAKLFGEAKNDLDSIKKSIDKTAIPLLASWLLTFSDIDIDKANAYFEDQIKRIQDNPRKTEGQKASLISKLMEKRSEMVLTQSSLEDQLRHAVRDVGFGSLWLEAAISSSDQVTSLFAKAVKFQEFQANFMDRMTQQKIGIALAAFEKEKGKAGNNIEKYYGELIQEVTIELGRDFDGSPLIEKRLVFRDVEDVTSPAGKELLSVLKEVYGEAQEMLPESQNMKVEITNSKEIVDSLPFVRRSGADRIRSNGLWNTIKTEFQEIYKPLSTDTDYGYTTEAGEVIRSIPIHYTKRGVDDRAMDNKDVTKDIVDSVLKFTQMANRYTMFKSIQSEVEFMEGAIEARTVPEITPAGNRKWDKVANIFGLKEFVKSDTARVNKRLQEFINMTFYGQHEKPNIETIFGQEIDTNKLLNFLGKWTGFTTLALNFLSAVNNVILGNFYMFQESVARQNFGDLKLNLAEGKAIYYKGAARMMGDIGKIEGLSKETQLVRMYDAMQGSFRDISGGFVTGSKMKKLWQGSSLFFMNHIGEHEMQVSSLFAAMAGQKLTTKAGEEINLWDAYSLDVKGNLELRDDVEWYDTDVFAFQNKLHATNKSLHGNYNDFDKTVMQKYTLGRLALMFRKFMAPGVRRRFGKLSIDNELSELHEGFFITTVRLMRNEMVELKNWLTFKENNLTEHEKANLKRTVAEIGMWITTMAMFAVAAGFLGDDDDSWAGAMVLYEIKRLQTELGFYFNPAETLKIIKSPAATTTTIQRIIRLMDQLVHSAYDQEYTHYQTSGHGHKKGDSKLWDATKNLIPAIQGLERSQHPEEAIKYFNKLF